MATNGSAHEVATELKRLLRNIDKVLVEPSFINPFEQHERESEFPYVTFTVGDLEFVDRSPRSLLTVNIFGFVISHWIDPVDRVVGQIVAKCRKIGAIFKFEITGVALAYPDKSRVGGVNNLESNRVGLDQARGVLRCQFVLPCTGAIW